MRQHRPHRVEDLLRARVRTAGGDVEVPPHHEPGPRAADLLERPEPAELLPQPERADDLLGLRLERRLPADERGVVRAGQCGCSPPVAAGGRDSSASDVMVSWPRAASSSTIVASSIERA